MRTFWPFPLHLMSLTFSASSILKFAMQNSRKKFTEKVPFVKKIENHFGIVISHQEAPCLNQAIKVIEISRTLLRSQIDVLREEAEELITNY